MFNINIPKSFKLLRDGKVDNQSESFDHQWPCFSLTLGKIADIEVQPGDTFLHWRTSSDYSTMLI